MRCGAVGLLFLLAAAPAAAQEPAPLFQPEQQYSFKIKGDALSREEWTSDIFDAPGVSHNADRWRLQARPRMEIGINKILLGFGVDLNYSQDTNDEPADQAIIRDNYRSRDARVDLAFARWQIASGTRLEGGRFEMPVALTEMLWDRDLRPQGGALTLETHDEGGRPRLGLTLLAASGSHVFDDSGVGTLLASAAGFLGAGEQGRVELRGSFLTFTGVEKLELRIRRQNSRLGGLVFQDYDVLDAIVRYRRDGGVPVQLVADLCWNVGADPTARAPGEAPRKNNQGLWLAAVIGSTRSRRLRLEYTFARVDKDATLAAYATDDFFWSTGWLGHRGDLGVKATDHVAFHVVAQLQRFKDSPRVQERDHWVQRYRSEIRVVY
jgi:putative porin